MSVWKLKPGSKSPLRIDQGPVPVIYRSEYVFLEDENGNRPDNYVDVKINGTTLVARYEGSCCKHIVFLKKSLDLDDPELQGYVAEALRRSPKKEAEDFNNAVREKLKNLPSTFTSDEEYFQWCEENGVKSLDPRSYGAKYWSGGVAEYSVEDTVKFMAVRPRVKAIEQEDRAMELENRAQTRHCSVCNDPEPRFTTIQDGTVCDDCL